MRIITVSREFGSGGRELGKRLADALGFGYFDREIVTAIAQRSSLDEDYIEKTLESGSWKQYPVTFSRTFAHLPAMAVQASSLLAQQHNIIKELAAQGNCVIVGRGADAALEACGPLKLFVHADTPSKIKRCQSRAGEEEKLTEKELVKKMRQIDKARAGNHDIFSPYAWGDKRGYHLCINTTELEIKSIIEPVAAYASAWFERKKYENSSV